MRVNTIELRKAVKVAFDYVEKKDQSSMMSNFFFDVVNDKLRLRASNNDISNFKG